jgi:hypothetical protein
MFLAPPLCSARCLKLFAAVFVSVQNSFISLGVFGFAAAHRFQQRASQLNQSNEFEVIAEE